MSALISRSLPNGGLPRHVSWARDVGGNIGESRARRDGPPRPSTTSQRRRTGHGRRSRRSRCDVVSSDTRVVCGPRSRAASRGAGKETDIPYAEVNGVRLFYELSGEGRTVAQIHGSGFGRGNFATLTPLLSRSFQVLDYDMRGFGDSDAPVQPYSMESWADDLVGLLDALELERVHVHGTSMGGMVAIPFAAKYPERVSGLVLSCSLAAYDEAARMNKRVWHAVASAYGKGEEFLDLLMFQLFSRTFLESEGIGEARELVAGLISSQTSPEVFAEITRAIESADLVPLLGSISVPTLVVGGRFDIMTPIEMGPSGAGSRVIAERIPGAELAILDSGHTFLIEQPEESCALIAEFLGRVDDRQGRRQ